jgi:hypothetical protein
MCDDVFAGLRSRRLDYAIFGSAAGAHHGLNRTADDVDVFLGCDSLEPLLPCLPKATRVPPNGLRCGDVEVWHAPLRLYAAGRTHLMAFDDELRRRRLFDERFGWLLSPEDAFVIKATLQRGGHKHDVEDAYALWRHWQGRLDLDYLTRRAAQCGASARVCALLAELAS